jgi:hypothetical protein
MIRNSALALGLLALVNLLAVLVVEAIAMASVAPSELTSDVSGRDYWLMISCIMSVTVTALCALVAYVDLLFLRMRSRRFDIVASVLLLVLLVGWTIAGLVGDAGTRAPVFLSYVTSHLDTFALGALSALIAQYATVRIKPLHT